MDTAEKIHKMVEYLTLNYMAAISYRLRMDEKNWSRVHEEGLSEKVKEMHAELMDQILELPPPDCKKEQELLIERLEKQWSDARARYFKTRKHEDLRLDAQLQAFIWIEKHRLDMIIY